MSTTRKRRNSGNTNNGDPTQSASSYSSHATPIPHKVDGLQTKLLHLPTLLRRFWKVASPFWFSDDKLNARMQFIALFLFSLLTTAFNVGFSFLNRNLQNALARKDQQQFTNHLFYYLAAIIAAVLIFVLREYVRDCLALRWRSWMTTYYLERYLKNQIFYKIQTQTVIDNPDQRIVDDIDSFTRRTLRFSLLTFNAAVNLVSFSNILYGIYPPLFLVLIIYSIGGTAITVFLGKGLVALNFLQEKTEADFRFGLVRVRENAESIAFYGGEENEKQLLLQRFRSAFQNLTKLLISSRNLEFFTFGYKYIINVLPAAIVAPMYFSGKIEFGVISQSVSAFNNILEDFSLIVHQFEAISSFSAVIDRLGEFDDALDTISSKCISDALKDVNVMSDDRESSFELEFKGLLDTNRGNRLLVIENLTLQTPKHIATLVKDLSLVIDCDDNLLVTGPSGSGKTSILRAIAGLWSGGKGKITFYVKDGDKAVTLESDAEAKEVTNEDSTNAEANRSIGRNSGGIFFLPQRPYMVLGTLRQQLLYPTWAEDAVHIPDCAETKCSLPFLKKVPDSEYLMAESKRPATNDLLQILDDVHLGHLPSRFGGLDTTHEWSRVLSLGEQQRVAFARVFVSKPKLVLLDESTSALDEDNEAHLYKKLGEAGMTYVSIGHSKSLYPYHKRILHITEPHSDNTRNWHIESLLSHHS